MGLHELEEEQPGSLEIVDSDRIADQLPALLLVELGLRRRDQAVDFGALVGQDLNLVLVGAGRIDGDREGAERGEPGGLGEEVGGGQFLVAGPRRGTSRCRRGSG